MYPLVDLIIRLIEKNSIKVFIQWLCMINYQWSLQVSGKYIINTNLIGGADGIVKIFELNAY